MAFVAKNLRMLEDLGVMEALSGAAARVGRWGYVTPDTAAVVEAANYFNAAASRLEKNHVIEAVMVTGGTPVTKRYIVTSNNGTTVVIALQTTTAG